MMLLCFSINSKKGGKNMTKNRIISYSTWMVGFFFILLAACSGGGGGSDNISSAYTGKTTQAEITDDNAQTIAENSFENIMDTQNLPVDAVIMGMISDKSTGIAAGSKSILLSKTVLNLIENDNISATQEASISAVLERSDIVYGHCSGQVSYQISINTQTGMFDMTMGFDNYCEQGVTMDGGMQADGQVQLDENDQVTSFQMSLSFNGFTVADIFGSATIEGSFDVSGAESYLALTMDMVAKNNLNQKTYWIDNFSLDVNDHSSYSTVDMQGRFYDYDYGYVDMDTTTMFKIYYGDDNPSEGVMVLKGKENTAARFTCLDQYSYMVEADINGDGTYDYRTRILYWL
jgi:hypothetical protein